MSDAADEIIAFDLPCAGCGYNLRTRAVGQPCPECGGSVEQSVEEQVQRLCGTLRERESIGRKSAMEVRGIQVGAALALASHGGVLATAILRGYVADREMWCALAGAHALGLAATWWQGGAMTGANRRFARGSVAALALAAAVTVGLFRAGLDVRRLNWAAVPLAVALGIGSLARSTALAAWFRGEEIAWAGRWVMGGGIVQATGIGMFLLWFTLTASSGVVVAPGEWLATAMWLPTAVNGWPMLTMLSTHSLWGRLFVFPLAFLALQAAVPAGDAAVLWRAARSGRRGELGQGEAKLAELYAVKRQIMLSRARRAWGAS